MSYQVNIERYYPVQSNTLFEFFTDLRLLERWLAPAEMVCLITDFHPVSGGAFNYALRGRMGLWMSEGHFDEIIPYSSISATERSFTDPRGYVVVTNTHLKFEFEGSGDGTAVKFTQTGFFTAEHQCNAEITWQQRFSSLANIVDHYLSGNVEEWEPRITGTPKHDSYLNV